MDSLAWFSSLHGPLTQFPAAAALLILFPILAAQRGGRGSWPWRTTSRYLGWAGVAAGLVAAVSGLLAARHPGLAPLEAYWSPVPPHLSRIRELGGVVSLLLGAACLRSLYRRREEHQGVGLLALMLGLLWGTCAVWAS